jgi:hypothetical protein
MKKFVIFLFFYIFLAWAVWGQNYKWIGTANDGDWTNPANWETGGPFTETIDGQLITLTYDGAPAGGIWGAEYFIINDIGNGVLYPNGSLGVDNLVIQNGSLELTVDAQCDIIIIEGGTFIRNGKFLRANIIKMTSGILDLNGGDNISIPSSGWEITGGILIRDNVNNYDNPPPAIDDDNVIVIGGPGTGGGGGDNFIWTGGADTDWDNADNWVGGNIPVPGSTIKIIINNSIFPDTNIPSTIICNSFVIADGANFELNNDLEIYSLLDNKGTFICNIGAVTLFGTITVKGDNTFYDLDCSNAAVKFENGKTQEITGSLAAGNASLDTIGNSLPRWNLIINPANVINTPASIGECNSAYFLNWLTAIPTVTDNGNNINVFTDAALNIFEWEGTTDTDWTDGSNWLGGVSPGDGNSSYTIIINTLTHNPVFTGTELICNKLIIETGASFDMGDYDLTVLDELDNNGNLILNGTGSQIIHLTGAAITANKTVTYDSTGNHFAGLLTFDNLTIKDGNRVIVGGITVNGVFSIESGSLDAASIAVTGASTISADITTAGAQTYNGTITIGGSVSLLLTSGGDVQTSGLVSGTVGINIKADNDIKIGAGGINVTGFVITLEAGGNIDIQGTITGSRLTAAAGGNVTVNGNITVTSAGDHDTLPGNGLNAAIYIAANDFIPVLLNSISPGTGEICLELTVNHPPGSFDGFVTGNKYHIHSVGQKNLVYYNSSHTSLAAIQILFPPASHDFKDAAVDMAVVYTVDQNNDIIIYQIGGSSKNVTFTIGGISPTGSIIIYGEYSADYLTLNPGTGGVQLADAEIEIYLGDFNVTANSIILKGTTENSIKAENIILDEIIADSSNNVTLEASDAITVSDAGGVNISFGGGAQAAPVEISVSGEIGDVVIKQGSYIKVKAGEDIFQADQKTLELKDNANLDVSSGSWQIGTGVPVQDSFTGYYGALKLGNDSELITYNFNLIGASANIFTVYNSNWADVSVIGDEVNIGASVNLKPAGSDLAKFILKMDGNGSQDITTAQILGSLHIEENAHVFLHNHLGLSGEMLIKNTSNTQGVLEAGNYNITMYAEISGEYKNGFSNPVISRWKVEGVTETISSSYPVSAYPMSDAFRQNTGGFVEFKKGASGGQVFFEITGNTVWQKFICREPGVIIQFSMHPDQHVFLDTVEVKGASANHITLTRYIDPGDAARAGWSIIYNNNYVPDGATDGSLIDYSLPVVPAMKDMKNEPAPYTELSKFWNFNLISTGSPGYNPLEMENLDVYFSHAWNHQIPISSAGVNLIPFYKGAGTGARKGYFNYDWGNEGRTIIYSFAEDSNGNGKVDRIRVQTNVKLNADFRNFNAEVDGYKIDTSRGQAAVYSGDSTSNGFDLVSRKTGDPADESSFYIYIEEIDTLYDGKPIYWRVTKNNNSLKDYITQMLQVGDQNSGEVYTTTSTIPPRVSYALTLPGHTQTFVQMSQPVSAYNGTLTIGGNRRTGTQSYNVIDRTLSGQLTLEYYPFEESPKQYSVSIPEGSFNFLLELDSSPSVAALANLPPIGINIPGEYFTLTGLKDLSVRAIDWNDPLVDPSSFSHYPAPRYPVDWNYSGYAGYSGNSHIQGLSADDNINNTTPVFLPPFEVLTPEMMRRLEIYAKDTASGTSPSVSPVTPGSFIGLTLDETKRRSTDVLVSITPADSAAENYFALPVWARYNVASSGVIWDFDGTKYLEDSDENDISVQVRLFSSNEFNALGYKGLSLFYGFEVPVEWRNPAIAAEKSKGTGGLWLPMDLSNNMNPLYNIVPGKTVDINTGRVGFYPAHGQTVTASGSLSTFNISRSHFSNGGKVEFVLRLEGNNDDDPNLFVARLNAPPGVIPGNWYTLVRPFSFDIMNTRQQRGGVTILNNVINSDKKEITYIQYNIPRAGRVTVQIYTLDGTLIKSIRRNEQREAGTYVDTWDGSNNGGRPAARGMYFVRVVGPDVDEIRKIMVVK